MNIDYNLTLADLKGPLERFWQLSGEKINLIRAEYDPAQGSPVFTAAGKYTTRGWTEWTQGFEYGSAVLQYDATGESDFLEFAKQATLDKMAAHVGHFGVHDHGFNNVSTYGNLLRLMREGKIPQDDWEAHFYELALKLSGAVQARRWTRTADGGGYIHSFNGAHSLFVDTIRTVRALMLSHQLGHAIWEENDRRVSLLERGVQHIVSTARYSVYYGEGRDVYDLWGRSAHESIFNVADGNYRCPGTQQGYSGFSTWTRGLSWAMAGFPEQIEFLNSLDEADLAELGGKAELIELCTRAAKATIDFFIKHSATDGIPYWDTGAPGLVHLGDYYGRPSEPYNDHEPVDSSAAAIGAQGMLRLGKILGGEEGKRYWQAGLTVLRTLLDTPYLSTDKSHQGLILHSIYHRPNDWDYVPEGSKIPYGESSMWGDYHARELALYAQRVLDEDPYYTFFSCLK